MYKYRYRTCSKCGTLVDKLSDDLGYIDHEIYCFECLKQILCSDTGDEDES